MALRSLGVMCVMALSAGGCALDYEALSSQLGDGGNLLAHCSNGVTDEQETDVDCGGACSRCPIFGVCSADTDCASLSCIDGTCTPVSGPPHWLSVKELPEVRAEVVGATDANGAVLCIGGTDAFGNTTAYRRVYAFDVQSGAWAPRAELGANRRLPAAVRMPGGAVYVFGGVDNTTSSDGLASAERYDTATDSWKSIASMTSARLGHAAALGWDDAPYAIGGANSGSSTGVRLSSVERYDVTTNTWGTAPALPSALSFMSAVFAEKRIYAFGGGDYGLPVADVRTSLSIGAGESTWRPEPLLITERGGGAAVVGADGRIYAIGGRAVSGEFPTAVEALRPGGKRWVAVAPITAGRMGLGAALGIDGRIYVFGGNGGSSSIGSDAQAYGPRLVLSSSTVAAGQSVMVSGDNFAANATVRVQIDLASAQAAASGTTDHDGKLAPLSLVASVAPGSHTIIVVDDHSGYPVRTGLTVTP